jgi:hypothetical protein
MPMGEFVFTGLHYGAGRPYAVVLDSVRDGDLLVTAVLLSEHPGRSLVPSSLWEQDPLREVVQFHKVRSEANLAFEFETFESTEAPIEKNHEYFLQKWWMGEAMDLVTDTTRNWERTRYPDNGQHDFCLLTYENIGADEQKKRGTYQTAFGFRSTDTTNTFATTSCECDDLREDSR